MRGHTETVKAVSFLPESNDDQFTYLISGSDDKSLIIWKSIAGKEDFTIVQTAVEHTSPINCIAVLRTTASQPRWVLATGGADGTIRIWLFEDDLMKLLQTIHTRPKFFPLSLALESLDPHSHALILAAAGTRDAIQIHTAEVKDGIPQFDLQATLTGHESWIRSLSFTRESEDSASDLLLASASQDKYIRIWRVHEGKDLPALAPQGSDPLSGAYLPGKSPSNKAYKLHTTGGDFSITFEALLLGHEDWIYSAQWKPGTGKPQLLSTSADNSLAIWEADPATGIWVSAARLGEISREKGATTATGSTGGFWTGIWSPDARFIACLGRTGSWRLWEYQKEDDAWKPCVSISGHTKSVTGISWSKNGEYLLSTSLDQTTRLHTQWTASGFDTWHEMSRPQIHGYDLNCIDALGSSRFVSGADEKLMRVFTQPRAVATLLTRLAGISETSNLEDLPDAANMPVLGLSNKAIDTVDDDQEIAPMDDRDREAMDPASIVRKSYLEIDHPPYEETLSRHTLWPETEKLYGHGYEISCLASSHDGKLIASACKASSTNHAVIRLFETDTWTEVRPPLTAHSLTAARLRFSRDDKYILSVGRDRQWAIFMRDPENPLQYHHAQANTKGHTRMILDCAWAPSEHPMFATAGRDKQVRVWSTAVDESGKLDFVQTATIPSDTPVTAVDFLPKQVDGKFILAMGTENGQISLHVVAEDGAEVTQLPSTKK